MTPTPETADIAGLVEYPPQVAHDLADVVKFVRNARGAYYLSGDEFKRNFAMRLIDAVQAQATALQSLSAELEEARRELATKEHMWLYECEKHAEWLEKFMAEKTRATTAEAEARAMREALEPFARLPEIPPRFSNADYVQMKIHYTISPEEMDNLQRLTRGAMR